MKRLRSKGGFTLIELLIVIIIIGILAAIAIPMFLNQRVKAKNASLRESRHTLQIGVQSYAVGNLDKYPPATGDLYDVIGPGAAADAIEIDQWPTNAWATGNINTTSKAEGMVTYALAGASFTLVMHGAGGDVLPPQ